MIYGNKIVMSPAILISIFMLACVQEIQKGQIESRFECNLDSDCVAICDGCLTQKQASLVECEANTYG